MKTSVKRLSGIILARSTVISLLSVAASAAVVRSSDCLDPYACSVTAGNNGNIAVCAEVDATVNATEIGATEICIYESSDDVHFTCVEVYDAEDYPKMLGTGRSYYAEPIYQDSGSSAAKRPRSIIIERFHLAF